MKKAGKRFIALAAAALLGSGISAAGNTAEAGELMWINHLDFLAGDPSVLLSFNAVSSGVGGGLSGLIIHSTTAGEEAEGGGNKVVEKALPVPPGYLVDGVRVCYELTSDESFISQIRLAQVQDPPDNALVLLDDAADLTDPGPLCVDSISPSDPIAPSAGPLLLSLRVNFANPADELSDGDTIVLRGVGLHLIPMTDEVLEDIQGQIDDLQDGLQNHAHTYLTGRGRGHNNTAATSGPAEMSAEPVQEITPFRGKIRGNSRR
jgi:hypothetical protein